MIAPPVGWRVERAPVGWLVAAPAGPAHGIVHYVERRRPLARARVLAAHAPTPVGFVERERTAPRRLVTDEGEHAALVIRRGARAGDELELAHAYVFLDDSYASIDGVAPAGAGLAAIVEALAVGDVHLLGRARRRRAVYAPPPGWHGLADGLDTTWYGRGFPREPARVIVGAALPTTAGLEVARATLAMLADAGADPRDEIARVGTARGLEGFAQTVRFDAATVDSQVYALADAAFLYRVRADDAAAIGRAVVDSLEPIPAPRRADPLALRFWTE